MTAKSPLRAAPRKATLVAERTAAREQCPLSLPNWPLNLEQLSILTELGTAMSWTAERRATQVWLRGTLNATAGYTEENQHVIIDFAGPFNSDQSRQLLRHFRIPMVDGELTQVNLSFPNTSRYRHHWHLTLTCRIGRSAFVITTQLNAKGRDTTIQQTGSADPVLPWPLNLSAAQRRALQVGQTVRIELPRPAL